MNTTAPCEICREKEWSPVYTGPVRDGAFGNLTPEVYTVYLCRGCGVERLEETACKDNSFYEGETYRNLLGEASDAEGFWKAHDVLQLRHLGVLWPHALRNRLVADIGCAAGSLLDHVKGLAKRCIAVEPCREYHPSLRERGYAVYGAIADAYGDFAGRLDVVFSLSTIEHVDNPAGFFKEVRKLLKPGGLFLVSTPNRADVLMDLLGDEYKRFFYRTVHRWYFDMDSLVNLAGLTRFETVQERCLQRFGISNTLAWLRDRKPTGDRMLPHLDAPLLNDLWKDYLESRGVGDYLYLLLSRGKD